MTNTASDRLEWLETDGLGGFASGTVSGIRTRRYRALLLAALMGAFVEACVRVRAGGPPHTPRGCPFQAWSVGEALRLDRTVPTENI